MKLDKTKMLTIKEVSDLLGKHRKTIERWIREGRLPAKRIVENGHIMIDPDDLEKSLKYFPKKESDKK